MGAVEDALKEYKQCHVGTLEAINVLTVMPPHSQSHLHHAGAHDTGVGPGSGIANSMLLAPPGVQQHLYNLPPPPLRPLYVRGYPGPGGQYHPAGLGMNVAMNVLPGYSQPYGAPHCPLFHHVTSTTDVA